MKPTKLTEFSVYLDQRPGEFAGLLGAAAAAGVQAPRPALALLEQDEDLELLEKIRAKKQVRLSVEAQQGASGGECPRRRARTGDELRA